MVIKSEAMSGEGDDHLLSGEGDDHLLPGLHLGKLEKIKYFDELRAKYVAMVARLQGLERRADTLEMEVKEEELRSATARKKTEPSRKSFGGLDNSTGKYEEITEDATIPEGWKSAWRTMEGFSKGARCKSYFAPDGRYCQSRLNALNYMVTELGSSEEDVRLMRAGLLEEGWREDPNLPPGWMVGEGKKNGKEKQTTKRFTSEQYVNLGSVKASVKHLLVHAAEAELARFLNTFLLRGQSEVVEWVAAPLLPAPWRVARTTAVSFGLLIISPDGSTFCQWNTCKEFLEKTGEMDGQMVERVGRFITRLTGGKAKAKSDVGGRSAGGSRASDKSWIVEPGLPEGWKVCISDDGHNASRPIRSFQAPDGKFFPSVAGVLRLLLASEGRAEEMAAFQAYMVARDGWRTSEFLPPGWFYRQKRTENGFTFLNQLFEHFRTNSALVEHLRQEGFGEEAVARFEENYRSLVMEPVNTKKPSVKKEEKVEKTIKEEVIKRESVEEDNDSDAFDEGDEGEEDEGEEHTELRWREEEAWLPPGWRVAEVRVGGGPVAGRLLRRYQSPCGRHFGGLAAVLRWMVEEGQAVAARVAGLGEEGWVEVAGREGWWSRGTGTSRTFLSPVMVTMGEKEMLASDTTSREQGSMVGGAMEKLTEKLVDPLASLADVKKESVSVKTNIKTKKIKDMKTEPVKDSEPAPGQSPAQRPARGQQVGTPPAKRPRVDETTVKQEKVESVKVKKELMANVKKEKVEGAGSMSEALPPGWRVEGEGLVSPGGRRFPTKVAAVQWMITNKAASEQIYQVWSGLGAEGWELATATTSLLPGGWRVRWEGGVEDWYYLSRQCRVLQGTVRARAELAASGSEYDAEELARFDRWAAEVERGRPVVAWVVDPSLPAGWTISTTGTILRDPRGARFPSRKDTIDHMIKEHYSPSDIFRLWNTLEREGWLADDSALPTGWKKRFVEEEQRHHYLSPMMEVVRGTMALEEVVREGREYSGEEREKVARWRVREAREVRG